LSNAFLPGFWPHSALYIGTPEDLTALGIADHPEVKRKWAEYSRRAHDGGIHTILEAVSEGVIFNTAEESMHADNVAVLRPRLTPQQIGEAITRAFSHQGKPYDFEFDFFTSDKLVCTELLYRSYEGMIHFDLVRIMGRDTLPALEIGRKFAREKGGPGCQLDFVLFMDGNNSKGRAALAGVETFIESLDRPREFNE
ncbi:MAG: protein tyrosine phosphatase, partial [Planctomycetes bacterium]|nr:protein tyrosine phosphatase [Planctomycetota bacterium]